MAGLSVVDQGWDRDISAACAVPAAYGIGVS